MKFIRLTFAVLAVASATSVCAASLKGHQLAPEAKVSLDSARAAALQAYPGKIVSQELEREKGGSGLRYSFDIRGAKGLHEVGIDAKTGRVLENSVEGPDAD